MNDFHEWMKQKHPAKLDEFFGSHLMNRSQTGQMRRAMDWSSDAAQGLQGGQADYKKIGWLLNTIQNMIGHSPEAVNYLIRSLMGMRRDLMASGGAAPQAQQAAPQAQPDMSMNPNARPQV